MCGIKGILVTNDADFKKKIIGARELVSEYLPEDHDIFSSVKDIYQFAPDVISHIKCQVIFSGRFEDPVFGELAISSDLAETVTMAELAGFIMMAGVLITSSTLGVERSLAAILAKHRRQKAIERATGVFFDEFPSVKVWFFDGLEYSLVEG